MTTDMQKTHGESDAVRRVAIVAVHGVGDPKPGSTVRAIGDLLLNFVPDSYKQLQEYKLRLSVQRVEVSAERPAPPQTQMLGLFDHRAPSVRGRHHDPNSGCESPRTVEYDYMAAQLAEYTVEAEHSIYETLRLETASVNSAKRATCETHLFEMYWADLSRPRTGMLRGIIELYQLLFELCILGRHNLDFALGDRPKNLTWRAFKVCQGTAEWFLTLPIPILNLCMFVIASELMPLTVPPNYLQDVWVGMITSIVTLLGALVIYVTRSKTSPSLWLFGLVFLCLLAFLSSSSGLYFWRTLPQHYFIVSLGWSLIPATVFIWLMTKYTEHRGGALTVGGIALVVSGALYIQESLSAIARGDGKEGSLVYAVIRTIEVMLNILTLPWMGLFVSIIALTVTGFLVVALSPNGAERRRSGRAVWTVNLTIVLPALAVLVVTLALWQALVVVTLHLPRVADIFAHTVYRDGEHADVALEAIVADQSRFLGRDILLLTLAGIITIWSLAPAVVCDVCPPKRNASPALESTASKWLGANVSHAFRTMRIAGEIIRWFVVVTTGAALVGYGFGGEREVSRPLQILLGAAVLGLISSRGPLRFLALGFRTALDVALGVINWLSFHPLKSNPRARISARYVSLLRHISQWQSASDGRGYDGLLVVAHSQGTVVTADLLRFLITGYTQGIDNDIARLVGDRDSLPIYLFTMGCPLRQLYSVRFPHLYGWVRQDDEMGEQRKPDPKELNVKLWVNAYRSGDYVGRFLWQSDSSATPWATNKEFPYEREGRREFCIGPGAHTHYWGKCGEDIALELDRLIQLAASSGQSR